MKLQISSFILEAIVLFALSKVLQAVETENTCPRELDHIVADMCTDDSVVEESVYGSKAVDSVLLRITKKQNNCICHVSLHSTVTNYTIYMSKYNDLKSSAPETQKCGLAIDVEYLDTSDKPRSLQSILCTSGTSMRSITFGGSNLIFKSRITEGDFTRGYCMQVFRNESLFSCTMTDQLGMAGLDDDWIFKSGTQHTSLDACKRYCMQNEDCLGVHYEQNYFCFYYNTTTILVRKDDSIYSQKHCIDTQKLKVRCYPPESTTQTDQVTSIDETFTTTVTKQISHNHMTSSTTKTTIEREKENSIYKDTYPSFLVALVIAIIGCAVAVIFAGTTVYYKRQLRKQNTPLASSANYIDLNVARDVSDYSAISNQVVNEQYETVNNRK